MLESQVGEGTTVTIRLPGVEPNLGGIKSDTQNISGG